MEPINYYSQLQSPDMMGKFAQGLQVGAAVDALEQQKLAQQAAQQAAMAAQQREMQYQQAAADAMNAGNPKAFASLFAMYPEKREALKEAFNAQNEGIKRDFRVVGAQMWNAINSGRPDIARQEIEQRITAAENSGQSADDLYLLRTALYENPNNVKSSIAAVLGAIDPENAEKLVKTGQAGATYDIGIGKEQAGYRREAALARQEEVKADYQPAILETDLENVRSQIQDRARRFGLDSDRLMSEFEFKVKELRDKNGKPSADAEKLINESVQAAVTANQTADQLNNLAGQLEQSDAWDGFTGSFSNWYKETTGNQDAVSQLRQEYIRLRNSQAIKSLPPGSATEKDVEMALQPFPAANASPQYIAQFLKGMAKMQKVNAIAENAKSEWLGAVGNLGKPKTDIEVDGVNVPAGMTYNEFLKQYIDAKYNQQATVQAQGNIQSRSYMRHAPNASGGW